MQFLPKTRPYLGTMLQKKASLNSRLVKSSKFNSSFSRNVVGKDKRFPNKNLKSNNSSNRFQQYFTISGAKPEELLLAFKNGINEDTRKYLVVTPAWNSKSLQNLIQLAYEFHRNEHITQRVNYVHKQGNAP